MVHAGRLDDKVTFFDLDADPAVVTIPHVKVARTADDEPNLVLWVHVLRKELSQLFEKCIQIRLAS